MAIATSSGKSTDDSNDAIARRLEQHRSEIIKNINPKELFNFICEEELTELMETIHNNNVSRSTKVQVLINAVESSSKPNVFVRFAECVAKEKAHLGHSYVAKLLLGEEFTRSMHDDIKASAVYKKQCVDRIKTLMDNFNVDELIPVMYANSLLTLDEWERLTNPAMSMTRQDKISFVLSLLETKGPTAHLLFVKCLKQKSENPSYQELLQLFDVAKTLKRKAERQFTATCTTVCKLSKPTLRQTIANGVIISPQYLQAVKEIHSLQYNGNCEAAIIKVEEYKSAGEVELYVALMCRNWYAYVTCKASPKEINMMVEDAMKSLQADTVDSDNRVILESRCEWMLSKYYWYMNDKQEAKRHIDESLLIQTANQVAPGEDTLLAHYGKACTLLDTLAEQWSPKVAGYARALIHNANDFAKLKDNNYGLYLSHHCIRLAQISLHSSPQCPGVCDDPSDLKEAASTLEKVDENSLSPRTKCLFYITYSDYYRNKLDHKEALNYVKRARSIAKSSGFDTELKSIEKRVSVLKVEE